MKNWEKNIRKVVPYVPGEQPKVSGIIKLNTNENPYPPSPRVKQMMERIEYENLRLYPDPTCSVLVKALADYYNVSEDMVFVGVGSDDVIAMAFMTFFNSDKPILFPDITYSFYDVWADLFKIPYNRPALDDNFKIKKEDYYVENGGIIFPNPNAPTGVEMPLDEIEDIVKHNSDVIVIIDEAYIYFGGTSALPLINKYDNLLVVQTFSKSRSMAGSRIGYMIGNPVLIKYINDVKYSYNSYTMDRITLELGKEALLDQEYFKETCEKIIKTRETTKVELKKLGFDFNDSKSNFIFATHKTYKAKDIFEYLKSQKIYVRYFDKERIDNHLRITVGTDEEMNRLIEVLKDYK